MTFEITQIAAVEILDSRGRPTLDVTAILADGTRAEAGVPSGASTGTREAVELRDHDPSRFAGAGVALACAHVNDDLSEALTKRPWDSLAEVDQAMRDLDSTPTKARLGANALIGTSMAIARVLARSSGLDLYQWLPGIGQDPRMPVPCFNVLNGGAHAPTSWTSRSS